MTSRNKALGRNRGPWTSNTLYLRGDVVTQGGALYAALNTFTSGGTFNASNWDLVLAAPVIPATPTLSSLGGNKNTIGTGLPPFIGRTQGDIHYDPTTKKEYVLTGASAAEVYDNLNRTGNLIGSTTSDGTKTWISGGGQDFTLDGSVATNSGTTTTSNLVDLGVAGAKSVQAILKTSVTAGSVARLDLGLSGAGANGYGLYLTGGAAQVLRNGIPVGSTTAFTTGTPYTWSLTSNGAALPTINVYRDGVLVLTYVEATASVITGNYVGVGVANGATADDFRGQVAGTLAWTRTEADLTASTLRSLGAPVITQGAGLSSFAGRSANDLHYDSSTGKTSVLTGVAGTSFSDDFNRADAGTLGGAYSTSGTSAIVSNKAQLNGTARVNLGVGPQSVEAVVIADPALNSAYISINGADDQFGGYLLNIYVSGGNASLQLRNGYDGGLYRDESTGIPFVNGRAYRIGLYRDTATIYVYVTDTVTGVTFRDSLPIASAGPVNNGAYAMIGGSGAGGGPLADEWLAFSNGTQAWVFTEPIYLQAQLASGNVAVGTHVLKPGIRVPTDTTLREMILRCDTIPTGSGITVQAERFNNGTSQGIIATATIAAGANAGSVTGLSAGCAKGDMIKFNVTAVGSTVAGADLTASLDFH